MAAIKRGVKLEQYMFPSILALLPRKQAIRYTVLIWYVGETVGGDTGP
jgi:hypothetical protein